MEEKKIYICSKCGMNFDDKDMCLKHEDFCGKEIHIRAYFIEIEDIDYIITRNKDNSYNIKIEKFDYPSAKYKNDNYIDMCPYSKREYIMHCSNLKFDEIQNKYNKIYVFTTNLSDEHEKYLINKIICEYKKVLKENSEIIVNSYNRMINELDERINKYDFMISEYKDLIPYREFM